MDGGPRIGLEYSARRMGGCKQKVATELKQARGRRGGREKKKRKGWLVGSEEVLSKEQPNKRSDN